MGNESLYTGSRSHDQGGCHANIYFNPLQFFFYLFNVPVINFSVMMGRSHRFLGIYQYFGDLKVSFSRTLHGGRGVRNLDLSLRSPMLYHCATAAPYNKTLEQKVEYIETYHSYLNARSRKLRKLLIGKQQKKNNSQQKTRGTKVYVDIKFLTIWVVCPALNKANIHVNNHSPPTPPPNIFSQTTRPANKSQITFGASMGQVVRYLVTLPPPSPCYAENPSKIVVSESPEPKGHVGHVIIWLRSPQKISLLLFIE